VPSFTTEAASRGEASLAGWSQGFCGRLLEGFLPSGGKNPSDPCPSGLEAFSKGRFLTGVARSTRTTRCNVRRSSPRIWTLYRAKRWVRPLGSSQARVEA
jgi:hypothetical protein